jgi:hypothetical protein
VASSKAKKSVVTTSISGAAAVGLLKTAGGQLAGVGCDQRRQLGEGAGGERRTGVDALVEGRRLELLLAVEAYVRRDHHVSQLDLGSDATGGTGGDHQLRLRLGDHLAPESGDRHLGAVLAEVQLRLDAENALAGDEGDEVAAQTVGPRPPAPSCG